TVSSGTLPTSRSSLCKVFPLVSPFGRSPGLQAYTEANLLPKRHGVNSRPCRIGLRRRKHALLGLPRQRRPAAERAVEHAVGVELAAHLGDHAGQHGAGPHALPLVADRDDVEILGFLAAGNIAFLEAQFAKLIVGHAEIFDIGIALLVAAVLLPLEFAQAV